MDGARSTQGKRKYTYKILVENLEGKRPLGRCRRRWRDNIRIDVTEIWWEGVDWMDLAQDRDWWLAVVNMVMNLKVP